MLIRPPPPRDRFELISRSVITSLTFTFPNSVFLSKENLKMADLKERLCGRMQAGEVLYSCSMNLVHNGHIT